MKTSAPGTERVRVRAPGKVNLALRVGGARPDGYHPLNTVFQALSLFDDLRAHGLTILVITHDHDVASRAARRVRMVDGQLTEAP